MRRLIALEGGGAGPLQDMFEEAAKAQEAEGITLQQLKVNDFVWELVSRRQSILHQLDVMVPPGCHGRGQA